MKYCKHCNTSKSNEMFQQDRGTHDALCYYCKSCRAERLKKRSPLQKAHANKMMKAWRADNPEEIKAKKAAIYQEKSEEIRAQVKAYRDANKDLMKMRRRLAYLENSKTIRERSATAHAAKKKRVPKWVDDNHKKLILEVYELSVRLTKETKCKHEVDHIIPLQGELVSGLHVVSNLQVLTMKENRKKYNLFEV